MNRVAPELNERRLAALAATGALGLDYVPVARWARARGVPLAWQIPPAVKRKYRDIQCTVTSDATSGVFLPQSSSEWTTFNALNGWSNPNHLYLCQEASGNLSDSIGSATLTASATAPLYHQAITGWSTLAVGTTVETTNQRFLNTGGFVDISTTSMLCLMYGTMVDATTNRFGLTFGTTTNFAQLGVLTTGKYRTKSLANTGDTTVNAPTTVDAIWLKCDHTNSIVKGYTTVGVMNPTFSASMTGNQFALGAFSSGTQVAPGLKCLYLAIWTGAAAEKSDADIKNATVQLGNGFWTPNWTAAYTAALAESESLSESVAAVYSVGIALSESESVDESLASTYSAVAGLSETNSLDDSLAASFAATQGLSETNSLDESVDVVTATVQGLSESLTLNESLAAVAAMNPDALAEALALSESLFASYGTSEGLTETLTLAEAIAALYDAIPALSDTLGLAEDVTASMAIAFGLSESVALAEAILAIKRAAGDLTGRLDAVGLLLGALAAVHGLNGSLVKKG